jgi:hypothetical protein
MTYEEQIEYDEFRKEFPFKTMEYDTTWEWEVPYIEIEDELSLDNVITDRYYLDLANDRIQEIISILPWIKGECRSELKDKLVVLLGKVTNNKREEEL